jgi:hypothetical protein
MSTTLAHLLLWSGRLSEGSADEAEILRAMISRRAADLRSNNFRLIAIISRKEEWEPFRADAVSRWAETLPVADLEGISEYLNRRMEGRVSSGEPDPLGHHEAEQPAPPLAAEPPMPVEPPAQLLRLYERLYALEAKLTDEPGMNGGLQGIRIMRVVSLMSMASNAKVSKLRLNGLQTSYKHVEIGVA